MLKIMVGALTLVEGIAGVEFTALTMTKNADVGFFAFLVFGVLPKTQEIMRDRFDEW
jgi:hypothetical protein